MEKMGGEMNKPRTFKHFPEDMICPICGTNEDTECLLLEIDNTSDGSICEGKPVHLWCAVADRYNSEVGISYRREK